LTTEKSTLSINDSDLQGGRDSVNRENDEEAFQWGPNMIDIDPLFVDPAGGDYGLQENSPCRELGCRTTGKTGNPAQ